MAKDDVYYGDYLQLDKILNAQSPKSTERGRPVHDETLFIITHQTFELWFKQLLHELDAVRSIFAEDNLDDQHLFRVTARLRRIAEIKRLAIAQLKILETMTPMDFLEFRDLLIPASGFQSLQFRLLEIKLGLKFRHEPGQGAYLQRYSETDRQKLIHAEKESTLFSLVEAWLARIPFLQVQGFEFWQAYEKAVYKMLGREEQKITQSPILSADNKTLQLKQFETTKAHFAALFDEQEHQALIDNGTRRLNFPATGAALLIYLYRDMPVFHLPYQLLATLVEIDELFTQWRYGHALMARRMIGVKLGTGGSSGYDYLKNAAEKHKIFGDFTNLSTFLIPRSDLPELPEVLQQQLGFAYHQKTEDRG